MEDQEFFVPDFNRLDVEWVRQPGLFFKYASGLADARNELDRAKASRELAVAELDRAIRLAPENYGVLKVTEAAIESAIKAHPRYKKELEAEIEAKHKVALYEAAVEALQHKKHALQNGVQLRLADYFSECRLPPDSGGKQMASALSDMVFKPKRSVD